jgi:hypothetical protein
MLAGYKVLKTVNKTLPHKYFHEHLNEPHGHCLRNRDDSSLFDDCYVPPMLFSNVINSLKMIWKSTNTETKDTIWLHIQVLMQLNDCCLEYKKNKGDTASDDS